MKITQCDRCGREIKSSNGLWEWTIVVPNAKDNKDLIFEVCSDCKLEFTDKFMTNNKQSL